MINDPDKFDNVLSNLEAAIRAGDDYHGIDHIDITDQFDTEEAVSITNALILFLYKHPFLLNDSGYTMRQDKIDGLVKKTGGM
jgi:hypothetical protein